MLETVSFNFNLHAGLESANATDGGDAGSAGRDAFSYLVKIAKRLGGASQRCVEADHAASLPLIKLAYRIAIDAHRTLMPLSHPPHVIAAASLYLALQLSQAAATPYESPYDPSADATAFASGWQATAACDIADVEGAPFDAIKSLTAQTSATPSSISSAR